MENLRCWEFISGLNNHLKLKSDEGWDLNSVAILEETKQIEQYTQMETLIDSKGKQNDIHLHVWINSNVIEQNSLICHIAHKL